MRSLALAALGFAMASVPLAAQDTPSVAEAAKRTRQQKQESAKPVKVITNDEIPSVPTPAPAAAPTAPADNAAPPAPAEGSTPTDATAAVDKKKSAAETAEDAEAKNAEIESLQKQIRELQDAISTQKGEIALDQNTFYSNPDYTHNTAGKDKLDREKSDLERMQAEMEELKSKLEALGVTLPAKPPAPRESITSSAPPPQS
jgi:DNA repair exonuclease SbcCD ATPase subunit